MEKEALEETDETEELEAKEEDTEKIEETEEIEESREAEKERGSVKAEKEKEKKKGEEIVEEKVYTIPLGKAWISPRNRRAPRAMHLLRTFVLRHMKLKLETGEDEEGAERLVVSEDVNRKIWSRGIEKPPRRIRVRAVKDKEGTVTLYLAEGD